MFRITCILLILLISSIGSSLASEDIGLGQALVNASKNCDVEMVNGLINAGANVNYKDNLGQTSIFYTRYGFRKCENTSKILKTLLESGADPNIRSSKNLRTPFWNAASSCDEEIAEILLDYNADPSIPSRDGETPIAVAARSKCPSVVNLIIMHRGGSTTSSSNPNAILSQDRIMLKNGDIITGNIYINNITIKTSYAELTFTPDKVASIILKGAGQNIEYLLLRTGDKLSGIIGPDKVKIELAGGQYTEIEKDKIKKIVFRK
jgi:ankyrin repeat protein